MSREIAFMAKLTELGVAELALLRSCVGRPLDENVPAFDLFTDLWWPLRKKNNAPNKRASWVTATLFPWNTNPDGQGTLGSALGQIAPVGEQNRKRDLTRFEAMLAADGLARDQAMLAVVRRLARLRIPIPVNWPQLLGDIASWNEPGGRVQRRWAKDYLKATVTRKGA